MAKPRISYVPLGKMDAAMRDEMDRCARDGTQGRLTVAVPCRLTAYGGKQSWI